jgi:hypothetical protein
MKALYGYSDQLAPFRGKSVQAQVAILRSWGVDSVFGGYENALFVDALHDAGLQVYAEFNCFSGKHWWETVPESRPVLRDGSPMEPDGWYHGVNPTVPEIRADRLKALGRLIQEHQIDGVWLDFIRWPCHWEVAQPKLAQTGFDAGTCRRFIQDTGIEDIVQHPQEWIDWRCQQITGWVGQARTVIDRSESRPTLGLFGVPWPLDDHDGAIRTIIGQDYPALSQYIDLFSPMTYHRMCDRDVAWIGRVIQGIHAQTGKPVCPIIQSVDEPSPLPAEEYGRALELVLDHADSDGVIVFHLEGILPDDKLARTRTLFGSY